MIVLWFDAYLSNGNKIYEQDDLIYLYLVTLSLNTMSGIEKQEEKSRKMLTSSALLFIFPQIVSYYIILTLTFSA